MTLPNRHLSNQIVHLTRRATQRQFFLKSDKKGITQNDLGYLFALSALRHNQSPHALMLMFNHHHICMTDNTGKRSNFLRDFHHLTTKVLNQALGRRESLWSSSAPGNTLLLDTEEIVKTMLYIWLNPVKAGLVSSVKEWKHLKIMPHHWGKKMRFKRPDFFRAQGENKKYPEYIEFMPMPPAMFQHLPLEEVIAYFEKRIEAEEKRILSERKKAGKPKALGMEKCFKQSAFSTPKKSVPMYARNPRFASTRAEAIALAVEAMKSFWRQYKKRLEALKKGLKVRFPSGTVRMKEIFKIKCDAVGRGDPHQPRYSPFEFVKA